MAYIWLTGVGWPDWGQRRTFRGVLLANLCPQVYGLCCFGSFRLNGWELVPPPREYLLQRGGPARRMCQPGWGSGGYRRVPGPLGFEIGSLG